MNQPFFELHPDFVAAARAAYRTARDAARRPDADKASWRRLRAFERFSSAVYALEDPCGVVARDNSPEFRRMQRLANLVDYHGPILGSLQ